MTTSPARRRLPRLPSPARSLTPIAAVTLLLVLVLTLGACADSSAPTPEVTAPEDSETQTAPDGQTGSGEDVEIVEGYAPEIPDLPHLGDMDFEADPSVPAATATATSDKETVLGLTDSRGLEWELTVPKGAVLSSTEITMKALKGLRSEDIPGTLLGGVVLEPDGLRLAAPATLTLRGTDLGPQTLMLTGKHDGSAVDFAGTESGTGSVSATLFHFSTAAATEAEMEKAWQDMKAAARAQAAALLEETKALNKKPIQIPPPPSVELECSGDEEEEARRSKSVSDWIGRALAPESELMIRLRSLARDMQMMGLSEDEYQPLLEAAGGLSVRGVWKAEKLLSTYKDRDKIVPITLFTTTALAEYRLDGGEDLSLFAELAGWLRSFIDDMISDIRTKHDYRQARTALTVAGMAGLAGADVDIESIVDEIEAAMRFKLETKLTLNVEHAQWVLEGEAYLDEFLASGQTFPRVTADLKGNMSVGYVSYSEKPEFTMTYFPTFTAKVVIDEFDPCKGTARLRLDRYYADEEYYTIGGVPWSEPWPLVHTWWTVLFGEPADDGLFAFPLTLRNLQVDAVDEQIAKTNAPGSAQFEVRLTHEPR